MAAYTVNSSVDAIGSLSFSIHQGHFPGAVNIPFQTVAKPASLALLPTDDKPILVYCYTGLSSAEVSAVMTILGYNAFYLNGGVGSIPPELKGEMCP